MCTLDILFIGAVMNYDGKIGSYANYIKRNGKWVAPFQYIYEKRRHMFKSEADACVYTVPNLSISKLVDYIKRRMDLNFHIVWHFDYHKDEILDLLQNSSPKLVAISSTLAFYPQYLNDCIAWINKHKQPETKVVVGGKWIYNMYNLNELGHKLEKILLETNADYYVINPHGEETLYQLLLAEKECDLARAQSLSNIVYRKRDAMKRSKSANIVFEGEHYCMNEVNKEHHTPGSPLIDFINIGKGFIENVVHVRTATSCPFRCRFCTFPILEGKHVLFNIDDVIFQLRQLKNMGVKYLFFIDDTFNVPPGRFETLMDRMIKEDLNMQWVSFFRSQFANASLVKKMYDAGCRMVFCGFESGNDEILKLMNKRVTVQQYKDGIDFLFNAGILIGASYFIGYPGETYETAMDTLELINDPRITFSRGGVFYYDPKAPVGDLAQEFGLTGYGMEWRHKTMNSEEAAKIHLEIIEKQRGINMPISDGAAWSLFNLFCQGISFDDLKLLYREFNAIQKEQIKKVEARTLHGYRLFADKTKRKVQYIMKGDASNKNIIDH